MPGTGKTTTVATLIKCLVADGMRVLLAAHTHSAVDNVLLKLIDLGVDFLRVSPSARSVHPDIVP